MRCLVMYLVRLDIVSRPTGHELTVDALPAPARPPPLHEATVLKAAKLTTASPAAPSTSAPDYNLSLGLTVISGEIA